MARLMDARIGVGRHIEIVGQKQTFLVRAGKGRHERGQFLGDADDRMDAVKRASGNALTNVVDPSFSMADAAVGREKGLTGHGIRRKVAVVVDPAYSGQKRPVFRVQGLIFHQRNLIGVHIARKKIRTTHELADPLEFHDHAHAQNDGGDAQNTAQDPAAQQRG